MKFLLLMGKNATECLVFKLLFQSCFKMAKRRTTSMMQQGRCRAGKWLSNAASTSVQETEAATKVGGLRAPSLGEQYQLGGQHVLPYFHLYNYAGVIILSSAQQSKLGNVSVVARVLGRGQNASAHLCTSNKGSLTPLPTVKEKLKWSIIVHFWCTKLEFHVL